MSRKFKRYDLMVEVDVAEGSFTSVHDLMEFVRYRLAFPNSDIANVKLNSVFVLKEHSDFSKLEG